MTNDWRTKYRPWAVVTGAWDAPAVGREWHAVSPLPDAILNASPWRSGADHGVVMPGMTQQQLQLVRINVEAGRLIARMKWRLEACASPAEARR